MFCELGRAEKMSRPDTWKEMARHVVSMDDDNEPWRNRGTLYSIESIPITAMQMPPASQPIQRNWTRDDQSSKGDHSPPE